MTPNHKITASCRDQATGHRIPDYLITDYLIMKSGGPVVMESAIAQGLLVLEHVIWPEVAVQSFWCLFQ